MIPSFHLLYPAFLIYLVGTVYYGAKISKWLGSIYFFILFYLFSTFVFVGIMSLIINFCRKNCTPIKSQYELEHLPKEQLDLFLFTRTVLFSFNLIYSSTVIYFLINAINLNKFIFELFSSFYNDELSHTFVEKSHLAIGVALSLLVSYIFLRKSNFPRYYRPKSDS